MKKKNNRVIRYRRRKPRLYQLCICAIVFFGLLILFGGWSENIFNIVKRFLDILSPGVLECPFVTKYNYYLCVSILFVIVIVVIELILLGTFSKREVVRDKEYILDEFDNIYYGAPAPTRLSLAKQIYGESASAYALKPVSEKINQNVIPIKKFLMGKAENKENILGINSKWGSGKTTAVLIAINETRKNENRYIYESAFKYSNNVREFINDVLSAFEATISELNLDVKRNINDLIRNLDTNPLKTLTNLEKVSSSSSLLTTEIIADINKKYRDRGKSKSKGKKDNNDNVFLIIDDLDRVMGEDLISVFSLLSVLRRFRFVKIIIPADYDNLAKSLKEYGVVEPRKFMEKYLPSQKMIKLDSGYEMSRDIALEKISHTQKNWNNDIDGAHPALAAVFFFLLSRRLRDETSERRKIRYKWLSTDVSRVIPEDTNEVTEQIIRVPIIISKYCDNFDQKYKWKGYYNDITKFQNVLAAMNKKIGGSGEISRKVFSYFKDEDYVELLDSWIFDYMKERWGIFQFTIRDVLDALGSVQYKDLPKGPAEQFAYIFNQFFPDSKISVGK